MLQQQGWGFFGRGDKVDEGREPYNAYDQDQGRRNSYDNGYEQENEYQPPQPDWNRRGHPGPTDPEGKVGLYGRDPTDTYLTVPIDNGNANCTNSTCLPRCSPKCYAEKGNRVS